MVRDVPRLLSSWRAQGGLSDYLKKRKVVGDRRHRHPQADAHPAGEGRAERLPDGRRRRSDAGAREGKSLSRPGRDGPRQGGHDRRTPTSGAKAAGSWARATASIENPRFHVVAYDYGIKRNILRLIAERGARVTVVPAQIPAREVLKMKPDGVFLANGPGDPEPCDYAIEAIGEILDATRIPVFGICLGHQLMGLASGAKTLKMKFGHHGANHPVKDLDTGQVVITSQNHGFAVDPATLPANLRPTHVSLFDGSLQGLARTDRPAFCFQGHPEASPGPHDIGYLFDRFAKMMERCQSELTSRAS